MTDTVPPAAGTCTDVGLMAYVHCDVATPDCTRVKLCPATVSVPVRALELGFESTEYLDVPFPPALLLETLIQDTPLVAVHAHPAGAVTTIDPEPPPVPTEAAVGEIAYSHVWLGGLRPGAGEDDADCVNVTGRPATTAVPVRAPAPELAATEYCTEPLPTPLPAIEIQLAPLLAFHAQPLAVVIVTVPEPAEASIVAATGSTE